MDAKSKCARYDDTLTILPWMSTATAAPNLYLFNAPSQSALYQSCSCFAYCKNKSFQFFTLVFPLVFAIHIKYHKSHHCYFRNHTWYRDCGRPKRWDSTDWKRHLGWSEAPVWVPTAKSLTAEMMLRLVGMHDGFSYLTFYYNSRTRSIPVPNWLFKNIQLLSIRSTRAKMVLNALTIRTISAGLEHQYGRRQRKCQQRKWCCGLLRCTMGSAILSVITI